ncbi:hypothetical protein ACFSBS_26625, partial [Azospirillum griseum]
TTSFHHTDPPSRKAAYRRRLRLTDARKPAKLAITAVMRKLVTIANALLRKGTNWKQKTV